MVFSTSAPSLDASGCSQKASSSTNSSESSERYSSSGDCENCFPEAGRGFPRRAVRPGLSQRCFFRRCFFCRRSEPNRFPSKETPASEESRTSPGWAEKGLSSSPETMASFLSSDFRPPLSCGLSNPKVFSVGDGSVGSGPAVGSAPRTPISGGTSRPNCLANSSQWLGPGMGPLGKLAWVAGPFATLR